MTDNLSGTDSQGRPHCSACKSTFARTSVLRRHIVSVHGSNLFYTCDVDGCNIRFKRRDTLERHKSTQHGTCKVICSTCAKPVRKDGLEEHRGRPICRLRAKVQRHPVILPVGRRMEADSAKLEEDCRISEPSGISKYSTTEPTPMRELPCDPPRLALPFSTFNGGELLQDVAADLPALGLEADLEDKHLMKSRGKVDETLRDLHTTQAFPRILPDSPRVCPQVANDDPIFYQDETDWVSALSGIAARSKSSLTSPSIDGFPSSLMRYDPTIEDVPPRTDAAEFRPGTMERDAIACSSGIHELEEVSVMPFKRRSSPGSVKSDTASALVQTRVLGAGPGSLDSLCVDLKAGPAPVDDTSVREEDMPLSRPTHRREVVYQPSFAKKVLLQLSGEPTDFPLAVRSKERTSPFIRSFVPDQSSLPSRVPSKRTPSVTQFLHAFRRTCEDTCRRIRGRSEQI